MGWPIRLEWSDVVRRALNAILLVAGAGPLAWALATRCLDRRRSVATGLLLLVGIGLNLAGLLRRTLPLRGWLRVLAVLVGLIVLAGVLATRWSTVQTLRTVSTKNLVVREYLGRAVHSLPWLAGALAYVLVSTAALPPDGKPREPQNPGPGRPGAGVGQG